VVRITAGFLLAALCGTLLAVTVSLLPPVEDFIAPVISVIKATPVASFIILALVWIRTSWLSVFISFLMVLPMVYAAVLQGIRQTDPCCWRWRGVFRFPAQKRFG
jgi:NitT/TauT family transport system permease protein